ncbi:MAG TPA: nitrilase-related carbon-nitrogen hydrolase [Thermotogota bacterium]|nr:nitrilase-related carbon-nitrogen hydrolase [Thermotogota bacterium]
MDVYLYNSSGCEWELWFFFQDRLLFQQHIRAMGSNREEQELWVLREALGYTLQAPPDCKQTTVWMHAETLPKSLHSPEIQLPFLEKKPFLEVKALLACQPQTTIRIADASVFHRKAPENPGTSPAPLRVGLAQVPSKTSHPEENLEILRQIVRQALREQVSWLFFPEVHLCGFPSFAREKPLELRDSWVEQQMCAQLRDDPRGQMVLGVGWFSRTDNRLFNRYGLFSQEGLLFSQDKHRLFSLAGENALISPGKKPAPFWLHAIRSQLVNCYELRFSNLFFPPSSSLFPPEIFVVPASWPKQRQEAWENLLVARALETQAFVVGVNRTGGNGLYAGGSMVVDPEGKILLEPDSSSALKTIDLDFRQVERLRKNFPFLVERYS